MANNIISKTLKCTKCKQYFYSYDGTEICDICSYEQDEQDILQEFKDNKEKHDQSD